MARPTARDIALTALLAVHRDQAYANLVLPPLLSRSALSAQDRAFATELTYGALRREGELDIVIAEAASRSLGSIDTLALDILRLGVYQALFMRVPGHAIANEAVTQAKREAPRASGFVNAVLRSVLQKTPEEWGERVSRAETIVHGHPVWIAQRLQQALSECGLGDELTELLIAHNEAPRVTLCLLPGLAEATGDDARTSLSPLGVTLASGAPGHDERLSRGLARVQDEGSQLAALVVSRLRPIEPGETWFDMCAGPGGKTAVLAGEAALGGATVVAAEKQPHRARLVEQSVQAVLASAPGVVEVVTADSLEIPSTTRSFDRVLLDAPCSGLGALRRRPEARWRKSESDIPALVDLQKRLLSRALELVKPGGDVIYVTCSPVIEETTAVISSVIREQQGRVLAVDTLPVLEAIAGKTIEHARRGTAVQMWTHHHHTDGMFIQILRAL